VNVTKFARSFTGTVIGALKVAKDVDSRVTPPWPPFDARVSVFSEPNHYVYISKFDGTRTSSPTRRPIDRDAVHASESPGGGNIS